MARTGRPPKAETALKRAVDDIANLQAQNSQLREQIREVRADEKKAVERVRSLEMKLSETDNEECDLSHKQMAFMAIAHMFFDE
jgi:chromosome segregation ATPase